MSRCTGHCCRRITIPYSPDDMKKAYNAWYSGREHFYDRSRNKKSVPKDIHLLFPMLKFLGWSTSHSASGKLPEWYEPDGKTKLWPVYSCKHFDSKEKLCTIYDQRPRMCSSYPDGKQCKFRGCTNPTTKGEDNE